MSEPGGAAMTYREEWYIGHIKREIIADARRAINDGNEDCIGLERLPAPLVPRCEAITPARLYKEQGTCPYEAKFKTTDGKQLCQIHAELWAASAVTSAFSGGA